MATPERVPIKHYRGDTLHLLVRLWDDEDKTDPTDLSGATVLAQVRSNPDSEVVVATFTTSKTGNEISLTLPSTVTQDLDDQEPEMAYDVQLNWGGTPPDIQTVLAGPLYLDPDVSRV